MTKGVAGLPAARSYRDPASTPRRANRETGQTKTREAAQMSDRGNQDYSPAVRRATKVLLPLPIKSIMKRDWHGYEHIPRSGGVIVAANHLSYADWAAMALFVHEAGRYPAFLIKSSAFNVKGIGSFLHAAGQFPVNRGTTDAALVLNDAERGLAHGECLIFYPEGTATRDPALWPMVAKTGVARLALSTGVPVIPVAQWGTQDILPYGTKKLSVVPRHTVKMAAGPPVDLSAYDGEPPPPRSWPTSPGCSRGCAVRRHRRPLTIPLRRGGRPGRRRRIRCKTSLPGRPRTPPRARSRRRTAQAGTSRGRRHRREGRGDGG